MGRKRRDGEEEVREWRKDGEGERAEEERRRRRYMRGREEEEKDGG